MDQTLKDPKQKQKRKNKINIPAKKNEKYKY